MLDYIGTKCPVCGVPFRSEDDIVVCPECGAPYHRACYQQEGKCVFEEELHAQGKAWELPAAPIAPNPNAEIKDRECPACGTLNGHSALFCNRCGASLLGEPQKYSNSVQNKPVSPPPTSPFSAPGGIYGAGTPFAPDPMGGVSPTEILDDGVTFGDASKLVKQNTGYYMPVFRYMKQGKKNKFNFSAFIFSGAWMLYRKQYKFGAIVSAIMFCIYIAYLCCSIFISSPALIDLMKQVGMDITAGFSPTSDQMIAITEIMTRNPSLYFKISLPMFCLISMLVIMIIVGVRGNKMYMKHCIGTIKGIRFASAKSGDSADAMLEAKGGVNISIAVCLFVCYMIIVNIPLFLP